MKKAKWLIQSTGIRRNLQDETWFSQHIDFIDYGIIPFTNQITNLNAIYEDWVSNPNNAYIIRGGTKILKLFPTEDIRDNLPELQELFPDGDFESFFNDLRKGVFYDFEKFDQAYYQKLNLPLLNKGAIVVNAENARYMQFDEPKFVKPSSDGKAFVGRVMYPGESIQKLILSMHHHENVWNENILISPVKNVLKEWRFFVLNGEIITGSQYHENHQLKVKALDNSNDDVAAIACAKDYANLYNPAELFTMDICLEEDNKWSIVEYNCFHCSGLYKSDTMKIKHSVEDFVVNKDFSVDKSRKFKNN